MLLGSKLESTAPAPELVGQLLRHAVANDKEIVLTRLSKKGKPASEVVSFNPHVWRSWFYSLWGQTYEWGCIKVNCKTAEANGRYYQFSSAPQRSAETIIIPAQEILEAHNFCVVANDDGWSEYWR